MAKYRLALDDPRCPDCGSGNIKRERAYKATWLLITCRDCGEESEVPAERDEPAAVRY